MIHRRSGIALGAGANNFYVLPKCYGVRVVILGWNGAWTGSLTLTPLTAEGRQDGDAQYLGATDQEWQWFPEGYSGVRLENPSGGQVQLMVEWADLPTDYANPSSTFAAMQAIVPGGANNTQFGMAELVAPANSFSGPLRVAKKTLQVYDSGVVPLGAAIVTPIIDLAAVDQLTAWGDNSAGAVDRTLALYPYADDGVTSLSPTAPITILVNAGSSKALSTGCGVSSGNLWPGLFAPKCKLQLLAAGAANGRLWVMVR